MIQTLEVKVAHVAKELGKVLKKHLKRERKGREPFVVTVSPDIRNRAVFAVKFEMPCACPEELDCSRPIPVEDQQAVLACLNGELRKEIAPLLKKVGLRTFEVEFRSPREGATTYRCTIRAPGSHP